MERLGISYDDLREINHRLVYLSISGFGETGPYAERRVYDPIVQALSGLTTIQAGSDTERPADPDRAPRQAHCRHRSPGHMRGADRQGAHR